MFHHYDQRSETARRAKILAAFAAVCLAASVVIGANWHGGITAAGEPSAKIADR